MLGNFRRGNADVFYSKIDIWLGLTIGIAEFVVIAACVALCVESCETGSSKAMLFALLFSAFEIAVFLLVADAFVRCRYAFKKNHLYIQSGMFLRTKIPYANIKSFRESNDALSAPACSLDRIKIFYGGKRAEEESFILVSPKNKEAFVEKLGAIIEANR